MDLHLQPILVRRIFFALMDSLLSSTDGIWELFPSLRILLMYEWSGKGAIWERIMRTRVWRVWHMAYNGMCTYYVYHQALEERFVPLVV